MARSYPKFVEFREEGPREGFQFEKTIFPLAQRAALVNKLSETGLKKIQVASFVSPRYVPQMADAAELFAAIEKRPGVSYTTLWLNEQGFRKALTVPGIDLAPKLLFYASDAFSRKNNNLSADEMRERQRDWLELYLQHGLLPESAYVMAAFGCNFSGSVPVKRVVDTFRWVDRLCAEYKVPLPNFVIADTMGWASPRSVETMIKDVRAAVPKARIGMHIHDTRGLGIANVHAALSTGVDLFETSVAGLGGCPFAGHGGGRAAGNVCTEDAVFLCHELGIETGVDLERLIDAARMAEQIIGRPLMGRVMQSGSLANFTRDC